MALWIVAGGESRDELTGVFDYYINLGPEANNGTRTGYGFVSNSAGRLNASLKGNRDRVWTKFWLGRNAGIVSPSRSMYSLYDNGDERLRFHLVFTAAGLVVRVSTVNGATVTTILTCTLPHYPELVSINALASNLGPFTFDVNYIAAGWVRVYRYGDLAGEFVGDPRVGGSTILTDGKFQNPGTTSSWSECSFQQIMIGDEDLTGLRIITHYPTAAGDTNTFTSGAFSNIDEQGDTGTDANESLTAGQKALFNLVDIPASLGTPSIKTLLVRSRVMAAVTPGPTKIRQLVKSGGIEIQGAEKTPSNITYELITDQWDLNPNTGVAWTKAEINALQLGHLTVA